jgi:hypothetical protein
VRKVGHTVKAAQAATGVADKLLGYTVRVGVAASVNQVVYGSHAGSFGDAFVQSFVASASAEGANWVGGDDEKIGVKGSGSAFTLHNVPGSMTLPRNSHGAGLANPLPSPHACRRCRVPAACG